MIEMSTKSYLAFAFILAFLGVFTFVPLVSLYGGYEAEGGGGHQHGSVEEVNLTEFKLETEELYQEHKLPDESYQAEPHEMVHILARQYSFYPNTIRMKTGERYTLMITTEDVVHGFSIQLGESSYNGVILPGFITTIEVVPLKPGNYSMYCSEYCGVVHDMMKGKLIVEGEPLTEVPEEEEMPHMDEEEEEGHTH